MRFWMSFIALWMLQANLLHAQRSFVKAFNDVDILQSYVKAYHAFEFTSQSTLHIKQDQDHSFEAQSHLTYLNSNHRHFSRTLFTNTNPIEVWINELKAKVKMPWQGGDAVETTASSEISHWENVIVSEVLDVFEQADFDEHFSEKPIIEGQRSCFRERRGYLCFDQKTQLPLEGHLLLDLSNGTNLQTR